VPQTRSRWCCNGRFGRRPRLGAIPPVTFRVTVRVRATVRVRVTHTVTIRVCAPKKTPHMGLAPLSSLTVPQPDVGCKSWNLEEWPALTWTYGNMSARVEVVLHLPLLLPAPLSSRFWIFVMALSSLITPQIRRPSSPPKHPGTATRGGTMKRTMWWSLIGLLLRPKGQLLQHKEWLIGHLRHRLLFDSFLGH